MVTTTVQEAARRRSIVRLPGRRQRIDEGVSPVVSAAPTLTMDIPPDDPLLAWLQEHPEPIDVANLGVQSPAADLLRKAGVKLIVPLVTQGELVGLLNLGERLSEQEYSADDRRLLENLAGQAAPALRVSQLVRQQAIEVRRRERYEQELRVATLIQQNFLPRELPEPPGWKLGALYLPAREVGGDFYDVIKLRDGRLGLVVGDVTDKGVPAALVMASTRSVLRASAQRLTEPGKVLERVNDQICGDLPPKMFVTCLYAVIDLQSGRFVFANAGHNLPCVKTSGGASEARATGMPLGLLPGMEYEEAEVLIKPGESVVLYSDAIPEAHDPSRAMYGFPRLVETIGRIARGDLIDGLMSDLHRFTGEDWEQEDDITILTLRRTDQPVMPDADELQRDPGRQIAAFTMPSQPGNERAVMGQVADAVASLVSPARLESVKTAVAEATMNAMEHGNKNRADLLVEVSVYASEKDLVIRVTDQGGGGPAIDLGGVDPDIDAKLRGDQSPRGWGLFLIRNMVDDLNLWADDEHHTIEMIIRLEGAENE